MQIVHMTYARVAHDAAPGKMQQRPHDAGVDAFLLDHVAALRKMAAKGDSPIATFVDGDASSKFERLRSGTEAEFLEAAEVLAQRLVAEMDGRTAPGLLVCTRISDGSELSAAALKLEVVTEHAAVLRALDTGEEILAAATNVLDAPGELQKGALVQDMRPDSAVVVGDRLAIDANYFPRAFGIRTEQTASKAAADLVSEVQRRLPEGSARSVARALPKLEPGPAASVLEQLAESEQALTPELRQAIEGALLGQQRPVRRVNTRAALKEVIRADGITVTGTPEAMRATEIQEDPESGGWVIVIHVADQPRTEYRG